MRDLLTWDPFAEMTPAPWREENPATFIPSFDVKETKGEYVFKADVPGIAEKDLEISLTGDRLTVSGRREAEQRKDEDRYFTFERSYGSFTRTFSLPEGTDGEHVHADLRDGVLTLVVPKKAEVQPKKIHIGLGTKSKA